MLYFWHIHNIVIPDYQISAFDHEKKTQKIAIEILENTRYQKTSSYPAIGVFATDSRTPHEIDHIGVMLDEYRLLHSSSLISKSEILNIRYSVLLKMLRGLYKCKV